MKRKRKLILHFSAADCSAPKDPSAGSNSSSIGWIINPRPAFHFNQYLKRFHCWCRVRTLWLCLSSILCTVFRGVVECLGIWGVKSLPGMALAAAVQEETPGFSELYSGADDKGTVIRDCQVCPRLCRTTQRWGRRGWIKWNCWVIPEFIYLYILYYSNI